MRVAEHGVERHRGEIGDRGNVHRAYDVPVVLARPVLEVGHDLLARRDHVGLRSILQLENRKVVAARSAIEESGDEQLGQGRYVDLAAAVRDGVKAPVFVLPLVCGCGAGREGRQDLDDEGATGPHEGRGAVAAVRPARASGDPPTGSGRGGRVERLSRDFYGRGIDPDRVAGERGIAEHRTRSRRQRDRGAITAATAASTEEHQGKPSRGGSQLHIPSPKSRRTKKSLVQSMFLNYMGEATAPGSAHASAPSGRRALP
jgi:hypothetical protein